jgi:mycothiol synthase
MIAPADLTLAALPAGYDARPATLDDLPGTVATLNAAARALLGVDTHTSESWARDWQMPGFDLATDTQLVLAPDGSVAGYANVWDLDPHTAPETWGAVHPAHRGRGLGTYLLRWAEARAAFAVAQAPARERVALQAWINNLDTGAHALLRAEGFDVVRHNLRMVIDLDAPPPAPVWPAGVGVRTFVPGQDDRETRTVVRACFRDHWGWVEEPFEQELERWQYFMRTNPDFDPSLLFLATAHGRIIGTSFASLKVDDDPNLGWLSTVGVVREWRRRGLAQALLYHSFGALYDRGRRQIGLGVDAASLTGATRLYEKVGMRPDPRHQYGTWEKVLRAASGN